MEGCYRIHYSGTTIQTTVTSSASVVDRWISTTIEIHRHRLSNLIVGLDIEWRPYFQPQDRNPVAVLQICDGHRCLIFQLLHADSIPISLHQFLAFPYFTFVGVGVQEDAEKLFQELQLRVVSTMDLAQLAADRYGIEDFRRRGLKRLAMELIGKYMEKPKHVTLSQWDAKNLSDEQVEYATIDAYVSFALGLSLLNGFRRVSPVPFPVRQHSCNASHWRPPPQPSFFVVYTPPPPQFV
ncbi:3'-5' exonuclease [Ziziphus jujuba]|uniref:3'-5' exonuclease n=1 Tax=Ziziphus jujuba TaxID=326968 RepID=A0ABM3IRK8_ZIZJJ|nr:3'-5' exonuclease [Ziziphus jujuba]